LIDKLHRAIQIIEIGALCLLVEFIEYQLERKRTRQKQINGRKENGGAAQETYGARKERGY
jgi:hypothetical protein